MGYVSYLEDIIERIQFEIQHIDKEVDSREISDKKQKILKALLVQCNNLLEECKRHLEDATNPSLDLAHNVIVLNKEKSDLKVKVGTLQQKMAQLHKQIGEEDIKSKRIISKKDEAIKILNEENGKLIKENKELNKQLLESFAKIYKNNPKTAYDLYPPPSGIKKLK